MDASFTFSELNLILSSTNKPMTISGIAENYFELTYNPGALLPNVTLCLRKISHEHNKVVFRYDSSSSFMLSTANFFSVLPEGIKLDTDSKTLEISVADLQALGTYRRRCHIRYFNVHSDKIELSMIVL